MTIPDWVEKTLSTFEPETHPHNELTIVRYCEETTSRNIVNAS